MITSELDRVSTHSVKELKSSSVQSPSLPSFRRALRSLVCSGRFHFEIRCGSESHFRPCWRLVLLRGGGFMWTHEVYTNKRTSWKEEHANINSPTRKYQPRMFDVEPLVFHFNLVFLCSISRIKAH